MARLPYVEMDGAPPEVREIYEKVLKGKVGSVQSCWRTARRCWENSSRSTGAWESRWIAAFTRPCISGSPR